MKVEVVAAEQLPGRAARRLTALLAAALETRDVATIALSGGSNVLPVLQLVAATSLPWKRIHVFQVDERLVPDGHPDRNLRLIEEAWSDVLPRPGGLHPMPVADALRGASAADGALMAYAGELEAVAGRPPVLDVVHLGLGADGHTASLVPGDPALAAENTDVALSGEYAGYQRMTLTRPLLSRARDRVWIVSGPGKAQAVRRLVRGDPAIPAGTLTRDRAVLFVDDDAAVDLG